MPRVATLLLSRAMRVLLIGALALIAAGGRPEAFAAESDAAAAAATLPASPKQITFAPVTFGTIGATSSFKKVTLSNKSKAAVALTSLARLGDFAIDSKDSTCGSSLPAAGKCVVAVTFTPTALGLRTGQLSITSSATSSPLSVALKGTGVPAGLKLSPATLAFAKQEIGASSVPAMVTVRNPNLVPVAITTVASQGDFVIQSRTCGSVLGGAGNCTIAVNFAPSATGERTGKLLIGAQGVSSPLKVTLKGKGLAGPCKSPDVDQCNGACTDFATDENNCGGCGNVCSGSCVGGQCQTDAMSCNSPTPDLCPCATGATGCTNFLIDPANCGGCGNACAVGQSCQNGTCAGCTGASAPDQCGAMCTNFQSDPFNCGGCGVTCASGLCLRGQCLACTAASPDSCGGQCTNVISDAANCGGCGNTCPAGGSCQQGQCAGVVCGGDTPDLCGGNQCTNLMTDVMNCGVCANVCAGGGCVQGQCVICSGGQPNLCGSQCTNFQDDPGNCGGCGIACPVGATCSGGACQLQSCTNPPAGASGLSSTLGASDSAPAASEPNCTGDTQDVCNGACVDFFTDPRNCGSCGHTCEISQGEVCLHGICQNRTLTQCGGVATDTSIDRNNCGSCGNSCGQSEICVATGNPPGQCQPLPCNQPGTTSCGGVCADLSAGKPYCGTCGHVCDPGQYCVNDQCSDCPASAPTKCGDRCVDTTSDKNNCAGCGMPSPSGCPSGQVCHASQCMVDCSPPFFHFCSGSGGNPNYCSSLRSQGDCGQCGKSCTSPLSCVDPPISDIGAFCGCQTFQSSSLPELGYQCGSVCVFGGQNEEHCSGADACTPCGSGQVCQNGTCVQCPPDQQDICNHQCVDFASDATACGGCGGEENTCASGVCLSGICLPGEATPTPTATFAVASTPTPTASGTTPTPTAMAATPTSTATGVTPTSTPTAAACQTDSNCPAGNFCEGGNCALGCESDADCPSGNVCNQGPQHDTCAKVCQINTDCPLGDFCDSGHCLIGCESDADCPTGDVCNQGLQHDTCAKICEMDTDCPAGAFCENGHCPLGCESDADCPPGDVCNQGPQHDTCITATPTMTPVSTSAPTPAPTPVPSNLCQNYNVVEWFGMIEETGTAPSGGTATLSSNTAITSTFQLTPSSTVPGGCNLAMTANLNLVQSGGPIFGAWGGPWNCGGTVDASGNMNLTCVCNINMPAMGSFQGNEYLGTWSFDAIGQDDNGNAVLDDASGNFALDPPSQ